MQHRPHLVATHGQAAMVVLHLREIGFPIVIEQFWTLRNYTLFHNELRGVWEDVV